MKAKIATLTVAALISAPAFAQQNEVPDFEHQVFAANVPVNAIELSQAEMKETEGAWVANAAGGVVGGVSAGAGYLLGGGKDPYKFLGAVGLGAAVGAVNPIGASRQAMATLAKATTHQAVNQAAKNIAKEVGKKAFSNAGQSFAGGFVPAKFSGKYY